MKKSTIKYLVLSAFMVTSFVGIGKELQANSMLSNLANLALKKACEYSCIHPKCETILPSKCKSAPPPPPPPAVVTTQLSHNKCKHQFNAAKQNAGCTKATKPADSAFCTGATTANCLSIDKNMKTWCETQCPDESEDAGSDADAGSGDEGDGDAPTDDSSAS